MGTLSAESTAWLKLSDELKQVLRNEAFEGLKALPKRGAEVGGLITANGSGEDAADQFHPVACEHLYGPSFCLSANDHASLEAVVRDCEQKRRAIVGWFRSCTRPEMKMEPEDEETIARALPGIRFIVLARPAHIGTATMRVFSRDVEGGWSGEPEFEVPLSVRNSSPTEHSEKPAPEPTISALPFPEVTLPAPTLFQPAAEAPSPASGRRWAVLAAAGVIALSGATLWTTRSGRGEASLPQVKRVTAPPAANLGLSVRRENGTLHLSWSRESALAGGARAGRVEIQDGAVSSTVPLRESDILTGSVAYTPITGDVAFRVELDGDRNVRSEEMIRVIGNPTSAAATPPVAIENPKPKPPRAQEALQARTAVTVAPPAKYRDTSLRNQTPGAPKESSERAVPPQVEVEKPEPAANTPVTAASAGNLPAPSPSAPPIEAVPAPQSAPQTASPARPAGESSRSAPLIVLTPPIPLRQVSPSNRGINSSVVSAPVAVGVLVAVDMKGHVTSAESDAASRDKSPFLVSSALTAARQWTFKPATQGGTPVPGEHHIEFVFRPGPDRVWRAR